MNVKDRIYGNIKIESPVIIALIKSKPFQRLKNISQDGAPHYIQPIRTGTRYEHSIGVWYLSFIHKRPIEEQIACLLHDIPHTAFSHVVDIVMDDANHEFHEKFMKEVIFSSEIPEILKKHRININKVLNTHNFPLLENTLPDISFDRWDYFMRDGHILGFLPLNLIKEFLANIKKDKEKFYFTDIRLASTFAILFMNFSRLIWLDPTSHGSFHLVAGAIKVALKNKLITEQDLFTDDIIMMNKLRNSKDPKILEFLNKLKPGKEFVYAKKSDADFYGPNKPRAVDPLVKVGSKYIRITKLVPSIGLMFSDFLKDYKYIGVKQV